MPGIIIHAHATDPGSPIDLNAGRSRQTVVGLGTESPFLRVEFCPQFMMAAFDLEVLIQADMYGRAGNPLYPVVDALVYTIE